MNIRLQIYIYIYIYLWIFKLIKNFFWSIKKFTLKQMKIDT